MPCPGCGLCALKLSSHLKGAGPRERLYSDVRRHGPRERLVRYADGTTKTYRRYECTKCPMRGWSADPRLAPDAAGQTKLVLRDNWRTNT